MTPTSTPHRARMPSRMRRAERSVSTGSSAAQPSFDVRQVDAGVGAHEPVRGLGDDEVAPAAQDPHRLGFDDGVVAARVVGVDRDQPALGLRHDLLRDDEDVAVAQAVRHARGAASAISPARSSPGWISPMPSTPTISSLLTVVRHDRVEHGLGRARPRPRAST